MSKISNATMALVFAISATTSASAFVCPDTAAKSSIDKAIEKLKKQQCGDMNTEVSLTNNPFVYIDPNASAANCGLGFELPGLPKFDANLGFQLDLCKAVDAVTGDMVNKVNQSMSDWRDETLDDIGGKISDATGGLAGGGKDGFGAGAAEGTGGKLNELTGEMTGGKNIFKNN